MSKTKNLMKRKTTGFDILYRVVTVILAVAMFPIAYFEKMISIVFEHKEVSQILGNLIPSMKDDPGYTFSERSIAEIPNVIKLYSPINPEKKFDFKAFFLNPDMRALWVAAGLFILALIIALVIIGFAAFSNTPKVVAGLSGAGFLLMIASYISFTNFFAMPIINGAVKLSSLINVKGILALALNYLEIPSIALKGGFFIPAALMLGILIWSVSVIVVNYSDKKEQEEKNKKEEYK